MAPLDVTQIRRQIPFVAECAYFDSASISPPPLVVVNAIQDYFLHCPINAGAGSTQLHDDALVLLQGTRAALARLVGAASAGDIVFAKNTTDALNMVAGGLSLGEGDEVITTSLEHQANQVPWFRLQEKGVRVHLARAGDDGFVDPAEIRRLITSRTRLVSMAHLSNIVGTIQAVAEVSRITRERGVLLLADGAQSAGRMPVDVAALGCDFLASCGRKSLMGPQGTGFLYVRPGLLSQLRPSQLGSHAVTGVRPDGSFKVVDGPERLEAGTWNAAGIIGLGAAVEFVTGLGLPAIAAHIRVLEQRYRDGLAQIPGVRVIGGGPPDRRLGIVAWTLADRDAEVVARTLYQDMRAVVAAGARGSGIFMQQLGIPAVLRTSFHCYNTAEEVDQLLAATERVARG